MIPSLWAAAEPYLIVALLCIAALTIPITIWLIYTEGAPWNPTSWSRAREMLVLADLKPGEKVYDLGAGDGRIVILAAKDFGATSVGIEIDYLRSQLTKIMVAVMGQKNKVEVIHGDIFEQDISDADVVAMYLLPHTMEALKPLLRGQLSSGTRIISHRFQFEDWAHQAFVSEENIYLYVVGEQAT